MDISICIPARNEQFLRETVEDIIAHHEAETEIIVLLDGKWADPPLLQHEMVNVIYVPESVGQRAGTNLAVRMAKGKYIIKCDAHCSFDQGFDRKMLEFFKKHGDNMVAVPVMNNLHAFNWKCETCGHIKYQGPTPDKCEACQSDKVVREMVWKSRKGVHSTSYCFDSEPHFQYFTEVKNRNSYKKRQQRGYTESMSLQGSFFMATKENYWKWELCDEKAGSWGNQGIEVALGAWLSGGRVLVNHKTWYAHMFRTQGGDFGFPYELGGKNVQRTKNYIKEKFWNKKHPTQIYPVSWLVQKFWPVTGWTDEALQKLKESEKK